MRVAAVHRQTCLLWGEPGERLGRVTGRLRHQLADHDLPTVGDWVDFEEGADKTIGSAIHQVMPRHSLLVRTLLQNAKAQKNTKAQKKPQAKPRRQLLCANVDTVLIMFSMAQALNVRLIERYLTFVTSSDIAATLVLSHQDKVSEAKSIIQAASEIAPSIPVYGLDARAASCKAQLAALLQPGQTLALIGPSGVGKSTLINSLTGTALQKTQTQQKDGSGRHTTVERRLLLCDSVVIIDTPGLRNLAFGSARIDLSTAFPDLLALQAQCGFRNCQHHREPGCAVLEALSEGRISTERWQHFRQLLEEQRGVQP